MTFGQKLQMLRKEKGLSQEQLAQQLAVSRQAVSKWELDTTLPETENIIKIVKIFNVSFDYMLGEDTSDNVVQSKNHTNKSTSPYNTVLFILCIVLSIAVGLFAARCIVVFIPLIVWFFQRGFDVSQLPVTVGYALKIYTPLTIMAVSATVILIRISIKICKNNK